ncbi:MAG: hypothetical protein Tsb0020_20950 [Haliangiales bacterium]
MKESAQDAVCFDYADILDEMRSISDDAREFLAGDTSKAIGALVGDLMRYQQANTDRKHAWETVPHTQIRTKSNEGAHQGKSKGVNLYGTVDFKWEIRNTSLGQRRKKRQRYTNFQLAGVASTTIKLWHSGKQEAQDNGGTGYVVGCWNLDVGNHESPGCHFHVQIPEKSEPWQYPIDIPRWPSLLLTPADAVDFVLGELFQQEWRRHRRAANSSWRNIQQQRLEKLATWIQERIKKADEPPWLHFKFAKPPNKLFLRKTR